MEKLSPNQTKPVLFDATRNYELTLRGFAGWAAPITVLWVSATMSEQTVRDFLADNQMADDVVIGVRGLEDVPDEDIGFRLPEDIGKLKALAREVLGDDEDEHEVANREFLEAVARAAGGEKIDDKDVARLLAMARQHERYLVKLSIGEGVYDDICSRIDALESLIEEQIRSIPGIDRCEFVRDVRGTSVKAVLASGEFNSFTGGWGVPSLPDEKVGNGVDVMELVESRMAETRLSSPRERG